MVGRRSFPFGEFGLFSGAMLVVSFREGNHLEVSEDTWDVFFGGVGSPPRYVNVYMVYIYNLHGWLTF